MSTVKHMYRNAIVRIPGENFDQGLTSADLGAPAYPRALAQHAAYCRALQACGLALTVLEADPRFPDSTFVEDTAVLAGGCAVLTYPGAASRQGEVQAIRQALSAFYPRFDTITPPGALDGGDICEADGHFFIGVSERTNEAGARQLAEFLAGEGYTSSFIQVSGIPHLLHLKSGIAYLGDGNLVAVDAFAGLDELEGYHLIRVEEQENYAANCVRINAHVLIAAGYPHLRQALESLGYPLIALEMSEFEKMDGGLSCLSLRF